MQAIQFLSAPAWQRLALTLLHFLWQGLAVTALGVALVRLLRLRSGPPRYAAYLLALVVMAGCPIVTFCLVKVPTPMERPVVPQATEAAAPLAQDGPPRDALASGDVAEAEAMSPVVPVAIDSPGDAALPGTTDARDAGEVPAEAPRSGLNRYVSAGLPWVAGAWLIGVCALSLRLLLGLAGTCRWRRRVEPLPQYLAEVVAALSERMGLAGFARVLVSRLAVQPIVVGYLRPMVMLPAAVLTNLPPEMLEAVIAHELAHIRRLDMWTILFQRVIETVLFYHPAVWWLSGRLRGERELCCDELAVAATGERLTYATALERAYRGALGSRQPALAAGLGAKRKTVLARVRHVLGLVPSPTRSRWWLAGALALLSVFTVVVGMGICCAGNRDRSALDHDKAAALPATQPAPTGAGSKGAGTQPAQSGLGDRELGRLWGQIGNEDHKIAYAAVTELSRGGDRAVAFMRARLKLPPAGPGSVDKLVADLNSDKYAVRKEATEQLALLGPLAEPALHEALAGTPSAEMRGRIEALLKARSGTVIPQAAWRILRAMRVLEEIGTPAAIRFLRELRALEIVPGVGYYQGEGHALLAGFAPDKVRCILGEPAFITFFVRNLSDKPYKFFVGGASRGSVRDNNFRITAVDGAGKPVRDPHSYRHFGGMGKDVELKPGEVYANRVFLGHWCAFDRPGKYKITCRRTLNAGRRKRAVIAAEGSFALEVLPASTERMRKIVAALGNKLRGGDKQDRYEATLALSAIHDVQVIPHLAASLRTRDWRHKAIAVQALSRFSTDSAAEALCVALKDPDHHLAGDAGEALKRMNKTDFAVDRLLVEFKKATGRERAAVARALGWTRSRRTMKTLAAALAGRDAAVRPAAAEAIGALGDWGQIQTLKRCLKDKDMGLRVAAVKALRALDQPIQAEWLTPVIRAAANVNDPSFHEAIRLLRLYGRDQAARGLVSCLHFDNPAVNHSYNMYLILAIQAAKGGPKYYGKYHHDPSTKGTPEQIVENGRILAALKAWLAEEEKVKRPELPGEVKQALAEAVKIRIKHPEGGLAMWRELAALVKPGWTMQHMKMIVVCPGGGGMMSSKGRVTVSYGVQGGAFMVIAEGKYVAGASYEKRDGDDKIVLTAVPRIEKFRPAPPPATQPAPVHLRR